jgi:hypothetical protein
MTKKLALGLQRRAFLIAFILERRNPIPSLKPPA